MSARLDLTGQRFGRLTAIRFEKRNGRTRWLCKCDCGNECSVVLDCLRTGRTRSCGCWQREWTKRRHTKHGATGTTEHRIWRSMKARCFNPRVTGYRNYGARGIYVCDRWRESFEAFYKDMGPRPSRRHSLDRIDNNGPYSPENCRWATAKEQGANTRRCRFIEHRGRTMHLSDWARHIGIGPAALWERIDKWGVTRALDTPKLKGGHQ